MDADIVGMVHKHEQDLYRGNGKPGLTTRMALAEDRVDAQAKSMTKVEKLFMQMAVMCAGIALTIIADLLVHVFTRAR